MPGQPKTRAKKRAQQAARNAIPDGNEDDNARAPNARGGARMHARARARRPERPGAVSRTFADRAQAENLRAFAEEFGSAQTVSIERVRPAWCSGWLEELEWDVERLGELRGYIAQEWGGQAFVITVEAMDGTPLMEHHIKIAGPPREEGRRLYRDSWEDRPGTQQGAPQAAPANSQALDFLKLFLDESRNSRTAVLEAVEGIQRAGSDQIHTLVQTLGEAREEAQQKTSLVAQLAEVQEGVLALDKFKKRFAEDKAAGLAPTGNEGIKDYATKMFMDIVADDLKADRQQRKPAKKRARTRSAPGPSKSGGIPDAN